jgi:hypothetical protein
MRKIGKGIALLLAVVFVLPATLGVDAENSWETTASNGTLVLRGNVFHSLTENGPRDVLGISAVCEFLDGPFANGTHDGQLYTQIVGIPVDTLEELLLSERYDEWSEEYSERGGEGYFTTPVQLYASSDGDLIPLHVGEHPASEQMLMWDSYLQVSLKHVSGGIAALKVVLTIYSSDVALSTSIHEGIFEYTVINETIVPSTQNINFTRVSGETVGFRVVTMNMETPSDEEPNSNDGTNANEPNQQDDNNEANTQGQSNDITTNTENEAQGTTTDNKANTAAGTTGKGNTPAPKTGDTAVAGALIALMLGSVLTISGLCYYKKRKV